MKHPLIKVFLVALSFAVVGYTLPASAWVDPGVASSAESRDYGQREAGAGNLEDFSGGFHEVVFALFFLALVATIVYIILVDAYYCPEHGVYHHHHHHPPVAP